MEYPKNYGKRKKLSMGNNNEYEQKENTQMNQNQNYKKIKNVLKDTCNVQENTITETQYTYNQNEELVSRPSNLWENQGEDGKNIQNQNNGGHDEGHHQEISSNTNNAQAFNSALSHMDRDNNDGSSSFQKSPAQQQLQQQQLQQQNENLESQYQNYFQSKFMENNNNNGGGVNSNDDVKGNGNSNSNNNNQMGSSNSNDNNRENSNNTITPNITFSMANSANINISAHVNMNMNNNLPSLMGKSSKADELNLSIYQNSLDVSNSATSVSSFSASTSLNKSDLMNRAGEMINENNECGNKKGYLSSSSMYKGTNNNNTEIKEGTSPFSVTSTTTSAAMASSMTMNTGDIANALSVMKGVDTSESMMNSQDYYYNKGAHNTKKMKKGKKSVNVNNPSPSLAASRTPTQSATMAGHKKKKSYNKTKSAANKVTSALDSSSVLSGSSTSISTVNTINYTSTDLSVQNCLPTPCSPLSSINPSLDNNSTEVSTTFFSNPSNNNDNAATSKDIADTKNSLNTFTLAYPTRPQQTLYTSFNDSSSSSSSPTSVHQTLSNVNVIQKFSRYPKDSTEIQNNFFNSSNNSNYSTTITALPTITNTSTDSVTAATNSNIVTATMNTT